jgi:hypothetical protein
MLGGHREGFLKTLSPFFVLGSLSISFTRKQLHLWAVALYSVFLLFFFFLFLTIGHDIVLQVP